MTEHTINAENKKLGRLATEIAVLLMGKNRTDFARNKAPQVQVNVINASKIKIEEKKREQKTYAKYSGYPGGLRFEKMDDVIAKKGYAEVLKRAVYGMLPTNKLRAQMIKRLKISE